MQFNKFTLSIVLYIFLTSSLQSQAIKGVVKFGFNELNGFNYYLDSNGDKKAEPPYNQIVHSIHLGLSYQNYIAKSAFKYELELSTGFLGHEISKRNRFPTESEIRENIKVRTLFVEVKTGIGFELKRLSVWAGLSQQYTYLVKLTSDTESKTLSSKDYGRELYENLYFKLEYKCSDILDVFLQYDPYINNAVHIYDRGGIFNFGRKEHRYSFGFKSSF